MAESLITLPDMPGWALLSLIGLIALAESLAFVGLVLPGVALLFALGFAAGSTDQTLSLCLLLAFVGAVLGDSLSFWLGRHSAPRIRQLRWLQQHPEWIERGERFFQRWGALSIIIGRFVGPLRPVIPFVAGSCRLSPIRFTAYNLASALGWAPAYLLPGYLTGRGLHQLPEHLTPLLWTGAALAFALLVWQQIHLRLHPEGPLYRRLSERMPPDWPPGPLLMMASAAVMFLACSLLSLSPVGVTFNTLTLPPLQRLGELLPALALTLTLPGDLQWALGMALATSLFGSLVLRQSQAWGVFAGTLLVVGLNVALKHLFAIERPVDAPLHTFSFPSGHASAAAAWIALTGVWWSHNRPHALRHWSYLLAAIAMLLIGLSRTLLGVHWPLDVLAGITEGIFVAAGYRLWLYRRPAAAPVTGRWLLACLLATLVYVMLRFEAAAELYRLG
ncbi:VTT domain-containing protein [Marinobacterium sp. AK62]|uniref:VTT domain-containing protein n=1 Tax=Marinobacterium alkalitolerans TaxID=1542925 RepID=A0ABS3ZEU3_9GAMM|nr:VTT domain-containing protein [Marinobacterium alkalitolerans]MBP0049828.1 VTT domain-containing protein [Marinobacterium alkalitolerans]